MSCPRGSCQLVSQDFASVCMYQIFTEMPEVLCQQANKQFISSIVQLVNPVSCK